MTMMLSPDLLDRRALALLSLVDPTGRPPSGPVRIEGVGVRTTAKGAGLVGVLAAPGLEAHERSFAAAPAAPAKGSLAVPLDITPTDRRLAPRRFVLRLPRDPDPAHKAAADSLFAAQVVQLLPSPNATGVGSACVLRVSVRRTTDGAMVENALVRARSDNGQMTTMALTDAAGEAALVFPFVPMTFPGGGGSVNRSLPGKAVVHADPASARFHTAATLSAARQAAAARIRDHADPDKLADQFPPNFASGASIAITAGAQPSLALTWSAP